jgi:hypothetical protein
MDRGVALPGPRVEGRVELHVPLPEGPEPRLLFRQNLPLLGLRRYHRRVPVQPPPRSLNDRSSATGHPAETPDALGTGWLGATPSRRTSHSTSA